MTTPNPVDESTGVLEPGMARAGAAAAARRRELDISQRSLAADGIINAGALIAFEKGRSWPRERTRAKLEQVLEWPPGTIARLRRGDPDPAVAGPPAAGPPVAGPAAAEPPSPAPAVPDGDEVSLIAQAVVTAVGTFDSTIAALPAADDQAFPPRAAAVLADLRQLEAVAARAARIGRVTPALIKALGTVRKLYDDLMLRAARGPQASLGQRLYAARRGANLTVAETAQAAGVSERAIQHAEAEETISAPEAEAIAILVDQIG